MRNKEFYMKKAIELAKKGTGWVSPNPLVGAVIVKDDEIIGQGYHAKYGQAHAEKMALDSCTTSPAGASMYVTLEPCNHYGKQPPCSQAIIKAGIKRLIIGSEDSNPKVAGQGVRKLRQAGIEVETGFMEKECQALNPIFFHYIQNKMPYLALKYAMTLDGKIASYSGDSKGITSHALVRTHELRHKYRAILVGIGTVLADDPRLTCRMDHGRNPLRIICDSKLQIPLESKIVQSSHEVPSLVATLSKDQEKIHLLEDQGLQVIQAKEKDGRIDLLDLMEKFGKKDVDSILVEGGSEIHASFLKEGLVSKIYSFIGPKILGGREALSPVGGQGLEKISQAIPVKNAKIEQIGQDFLIESEL